MKHSPGGNNVGNKFTVDRKREARDRQTCLCMLTNLKQQSDSDITENYFQCFVFVFLLQYFSIVCLHVDFTLVTSFTEQGG